MFVQDCSWILSIPLLLTLIYLQYLKHNNDDDDEGNRGHDNLIQLSIHVYYILFYHGKSINLEDFILCNTKIRVR